MEGSLASGPPPPWNFSFQGVLVIPSTPWDFRNFSTWLHPLESCYTILLCERQLIFFCHKMNKIFSFMLIRFLIIARTFLASFTYWSLGILSFLSVAFVIEYIPVWLAKTNLTTTITLAWEKDSLVFVNVYSGAPWVRKCGNLPIRENLVITWPYARPSVRTTGIPM